MMASRKPARLNNCLNCGTQVHDLFCPHCGQSTRDLRVSIGLLLTEYFGNVFNFDSKLVRSIRSLILEPGMLTRHFIDGKRNGYLSPVRFYFVSSLLFFVSFQYVMQHQAKDSIHVGTSVDLSKSEKSKSKAAGLAEKGDVVLPDEDEEDLDLPVEAKAALDKLDAQQKLELGNSFKGISIHPETGSQKMGKTKVDPSTDTAQDPESSEEPTSTAPAEEDGTPSDKGSAEAEPDPTDLADETMRERFERRIQEGGDKLSGMTKEEIFRKFIPMIMEASSKGLLLLLPLFALGMKLLYIRRDPLYLDHMIFALFYHCFLFLFLTILMWWGYLMTSEVGIPIFFAINLIVPIYLYKSMRRVYGQTRLRTGLKLVAILTLHLTMFLGLSLVSTVYAMLALE